MARGMKGWARWSGSFRGISRRPFVKKTWPHRNANPVTDPAQIETSLRAVMDRVFPKLARAALLVG